MGFQAFIQHVEPPPPKRPWLKLKVKGGGTPGYVAYGATKRGLPQMTESLVKELEVRTRQPDIR